MGGVGIAGAGKNISGWEAHRACMHGNKEECLNTTFTAELYVGVRVVLVLCCGSAVPCFVSCDVLVHTCTASFISNTCRCESILACVVAPGVGKV